MSITNEAVARTLRAYLALHPEDGVRLGPLLAAAEAPAAGSARLTWRRTMPGHVTCSVVAVNPRGRVLLIHHRAADLWLQPGGHVEDTDLSLLGAAIRELAEETGIGRRRVTPLLDVPVDVDIHWVGASAARQEPEHLHYDFRFLVAVDGTRIRPTPPPSPPRPASPRRSPAPMASVPPEASVPPRPPAERDDPESTGPLTTPPLTTHPPTTCPDTGLLLAADEVAGARWGDVSALAERLAERVSAVLATLPAHR